MFHQVSQIDKGLSDNPSYKAIDEDENFMKDRANQKRLFNPLTYHHHPCDLQINLGSCQSLKKLSSRAVPC